MVRQDDTGRVSAGGGQVQTSAKRSFPQQGKVKAGRLGGALGASGGALVAALEVGLVGRMRQNHVPGSVKVALIRALE